MTIAVVAVLVILIGLPLAAVWWSRRAFWQPDPRTSRWVPLQLPVAITAAVLLVAGAGYNVATEGWSQVPWSALLWLIPVGAIWGGPRRAIRRNRD